MHHNHQNHRIKIVAFQPSWQLFPTIYTVSYMYTNCQF